MRDLPEENIVQMHYIICKICMHFHNGIADSYMDGLEPKALELPAQVRSGGCRGKFAG